MRPAYSNKDTASDGSDRARAARMAAFPIRARAARNHRAPRRWGSCAATLCFERSNKERPSVLIVSRRVHPRLSGALFRLARKPLPRGSPDS